jgi:aminomethyltransferase
VIVKNSPLHQKHLGLQAKMADFGGWLMPIEYPAAGVLAEHAAVRERVGLFDVSHLGKASVKGTGALDFLNGILTNDLNRISDGMAQYTMLCNDKGGVIDDLIAYRNSPNDIFLVPNASNTSDVVSALQAQVIPGIEIKNLHNEYAVLALQGPATSKVLESLGISPTIDYMSFTHVQIAQCDVILCRTGYTGEFGFELLPLWNDAEKVWDALVAAIEPFQGLVCGLGSRDTLRTEMGYPLHGHELSLEITPVQASASWAVGWTKEKFAGDSVLRSERTNGPRRFLHGLKSLDRGIPRAGMTVKDSDGIDVGIVTSGTFSPTLKNGIALALLDSSVTLGTMVVIDVRGRESQAEVVTLPFVQSHVR